MFFNINRSVIAFIVMFYLNNGSFRGFECYAFFQDDLDEGSPCVNDGESGVCTAAPSCPEAREAIKYRRPHNLVRCGFKGFTEIVCCPPEEEPLDNKSGSELWPHSHSTTTNGAGASRAEVRGPTVARKSTLACNQYLKEVKITLSYFIVDGEDAGVGEFPHMAALGYRPPGGGALQFNCGGSLISRLYVITAAHCVINIERNPPVVARLGTVIANGRGGQDYDIANITVHPQYKWKEKINDIALLRLRTKVESSEIIQPACLYAQGDDPVGLVVTGWGTTSAGGDNSVILQKASLAPVALDQCNTTYMARTKRKLVKSQLCAADKTSDACQGDSGGPLQIQNSNRSSVYSIVGITSYGIGCGSKYPGIYTRVSSYLDWIENIVWP